MRNPPSRPAMRSISSSQRKCAGAEAVAADGVVAVAGAVAADGAVGAGAGAVGITAGAAGITAGVAAAGAVATGDAVTGNVRGDGAGMAFAVPALSGRRGLHSIRLFDFRRSLEIRLRVLRVKVLQPSAFFDQIEMVSDNTGLVAGAAEHDHAAVGAADDGIEII